MNNIGAHDIVVGERRRRLVQTQSKKVLDPDGFGDKKIGYLGASMGGSVV